jgi:tRNA threonylcarbamoyladenosine biosynthesis protein TsaE
MTDLMLATPTATGQLGAALARHLPEQPVVLYLEGELGAGKTTTARALLRALGVQGAVRSPTYTLVERYDSPHGELVHLDLYRIAAPEELEYLALDELAASAHLWLVEWPQRGRGVLPAADLELRLAVDGASRRAHLVPVSAAGSLWARNVLTDRFAHAGGI